MKTILCFGDSNTFGYDSETYGRFDENIRWTSLLQRNLKDFAKIIEYGQNGRTVAFDDKFKGQNGIKVISDSIDKCSELDLIVIMLGTNDCKDEFNSSAKAISENMRNLIIKALETANAKGFDVKILLISPVPINENCYNGFMGFGKNSPRISEELASFYSVIAEQLNIDFADAGKLNIELASDGCHYTPEGHKIFAENITDIIRKIFI